MGKRVSVKTMLELAKLDGQMVDVVEVDLLEDVDGMPLAVAAESSRETLVVVPEALGWVDDEPGQHRLELLAGPRGMEILWGLRDVHELDSENDVDRDRELDETEEENDD